MGAILSTPIIGANTDRRTTTPEFPVGTPAIAASKTTYAYVYVYVGPATNAIADAAACTMTGAFAVNNTAGNYTAEKAFAAGDYGWVAKTNSQL